MTPHAVSRGDIPSDLFAIFKEMRRKIEDIPDYESEIFTCHAICEALTKKYPSIARIDGTFGNLFDHSWLVHKAHPKVIMDMYPVAGGSSFIVYTGISLLPWEKLYKKRKINYDKEILKRQVKKILSVIP